MKAKLEKLYKGQLSEGPIWDNEKNRLLFVDILNNRLNIYSPDSRTLHHIEFPTNVTSVAKINHSELLLTTRNKVILYDENQKEIRDFLTLPISTDTIRFNDGKCDPYNRFWVGTMSETGETGKASLYVIDAHGNITKAKEGVTISNGMAWNQSADTMYFIDTPTKKVMAYPFSVETSKLVNGRVIIDLNTIDGAPDGMTIDKNDRLWIALWGGSQVICVDPKLGEIVESISLPVSNVTSCAFGGKDLQTLYITTAREGVPHDRIDVEKQAGSLFAYKLPIAGTKSNLYKYEI
ncbi:MULTISPECIES: SMP-30/gluconolactonase/LRE family protein [Clostridia]|uniref:SMP-30/gluconolactonase/LRE family protein n=1 Tax=Clostridia TaxID=186801 RepID=UPI000EA1E7B0|nr:MULTISPECIES: SMP-30/gluconolactonase/LRE family protein [Clostridia]NBJ71414.1 SMP-30/gluconolactonase/LRE family protein [Roseburia sp. 1XD42-34]RKI74631.1 SMP-30/gluconolactonase/LRE family protein [Clostridium sp. 1xD42-85]